MTGDRIASLAQALGTLLGARGLRVVTAESCTGGLLAGAITSVAGSSAFFDEGYVTYSNAAKTRLLGVPEAVLAAHGAVSEPVVRAMEVWSTRPSRMMQWASEWKRARSPLGLSGMCQVAAWAVSVERGSMTMMCGLR